MGLAMETQELSPYDPSDPSLPDGMNPWWFYHRDELEEMRSLGLSRGLDDSGSLTANDLAILTNLLNQIKDIRSGIGGGNLTKKARISIIKNLSYLIGFLEGRGVDAFGGSMIGAAQQLQVSSADFSTILDHIIEALTDVVTARNTRFNGRKFVGGLTKVLAGAIIATEIAPAAFLAAGP